MTRRPAAAAARAARTVRGLWPDRNPLRRTIDRIQAVMAGGLVVAFLAGAPLAAVAGGHAAYGSAARIARAQRPPGIRRRRCCSPPPQPPCTARTK
jgi:hypothetical protein